MTWYFGSAFAPGWGPQLHLILCSQVIMLLKSLCGGSNTDIDQSHGNTSDSKSSCSGRPAAPDAAARDGRYAKKQGGFLDQLTQREAFWAAALLFFAIMYVANAAAMRV
jgi:hypothetical protein